MTDKLNLMQKLIEIRKEIGILQKTESGNKGAKYVDPEVLLLKAREGMNKHSVLLTCEVLNHTITQIKAPTKNDQNNVDFLFNGALVYKWMDADSDDVILCNWVATATHMQDPSMAFGGALTYSERYFMMKFFQIPTPKDDPELLKGKAGVIECVNEEQIANIDALIQEVGADRVKFLAVMGVSKLSEMYASNYKVAIDKLELKRDYNK